MARQKQPNVDQLAELGDSRLDQAAGLDAYQHEDPHEEREERELSESRGVDDREVTEDREVTDKSRLDMLRTTFAKEILPDLPPIPGYHTIWLTTTNPRDSLQRRLSMMGYELIKPEDISAYPALKEITLRTGNYAGAIGINEMVACKLPLDLYAQYMKEFHHTQPRHEELKLVSAIDDAQAGLRGRSKMMEGGGQSDLRREVPAPRFVTRDGREGSIKTRKDI